MNKFFIILIGLIISLSAKSQNWDSLQGGIPYVTGVRVMYADTFDNYLYTGGNFYFQTNGKYFSQIARWDGLQWDTMQTGIVGAGNVLAMERYNGDLYVAGAFDTAGSVSARNIAKWNGNNWDSLSIQPFKSSWTSGINSMAVINNELYMGGTFDTVAGMPVTGLAKWNDSNWSGVNFPNLQSFYSIFSIVEYNGEIYAAGNFSNGIPNDTLGEIARYDGVNWRSVGGGIHGSISEVASMAVYNGELYVAGYFFKSNGNVGNHIQKWNGTTWSDVGGGTNLNNGQITKLLVHNNKLYAMGVLDSAGGIPASKIAIWDSNVWCGLGSSFDNTVWTSCIYKDTLHIGGGFLTIDGDSINRIAKWTGGNFVDTCGAIVGIEGNVNLEREINIYPNPNRGSFSIDLDNTENTIIKIYNISGQLILQKKLTQNITKIDISYYPKGIYFVKLETDNKVVVKKIVYQ
ncbi:MAG: T9SS type A sorting domain-containing protein [Flavobacteriales bacterium]|nr:T9SS type A sorting domain-containing protein [Flavobacteriales bacterium]